MNETLTFVFAFGGGILLGLFFFGGLWWTVKKCVSTKNPPAWFLGSLFLRMVIVITGFYFIGRNNWKSMLFCLSGLIAGRFIVTRLTHESEKIEINPEKETRHAS